MPARTNHGFLSTLRSLQSNCACELFILWELGLNHDLFFLVKRIMQ